MRPVAVLDANVLVPIIACDFLLTAFDLQLFEAIVSSTVLDEVERTLIEDFPHLDRGGLRRRVENMRSALADQTVETGMFDGVPDAINTKDRHLIAAALVAQATVVVTNDNALRAAGEDPIFSITAGSRRAAWPVISPPAELRQHDESAWMTSCGAPSRTFSVRRTATVGQRARTPLSTTNVPTAGTVSGVASSTLVADRRGHRRTEVH